MIAKNLVKQFRNGVKYVYKAPRVNTNPTICFIPGFRSDFITSKKSNFIYDVSVENGFGFLSWNHSTDGSVYDWYQDGLQLLQEYKTDYLVGASMGLWISLLLSMQQNVRGIIGIGGGVDFTERWLNQEVPKDCKDIWKRPSQYDESGYYEIPIQFLIQSKQALLASRQNQLNELECPVYLIHGDQDQDVSGQETFGFLSKHVKSVSYFEIKGGDHQLSRDQDLIFVKEKLLQLIRI